MRYLHPLMHLFRRVLLRASTVFTIAFLFICSGCASYTTPGGPAHLDELDAASSADASRQPSVPFPANIAVVQVQAAHYRSPSSEGFGRGRYSLLEIHEPPSADPVQLISAWPSVTSVALLDRGLLPAELLSLDDLRLAAAKGQADILLVYTVATSFRIGEKDYGPASKISLEPDNKASITSTASAIFVDVKTGFVYSRTQATAKSGDLAGAGKSAEALDAKRIENEHQSVKLLLAGAGTVWASIVMQYR